MGRVQKHKKSQPRAELIPLGDKLLKFKPTKSRYSLDEVMKLTSLSRQQVMTLSKVGLVSPTFRRFSKTRTMRPAVFYSVQDVLKALVISDMRHAKISLQKVRKVAKNLADLGQPLDANTYLLTDGESVHVANNIDQVVDVLRHHRQMFLLVSMEVQIAKLLKTA
jgi:DNA-binding transcriptional MerR regulator